MSLTDIIITLWSGFYVVLLRIYYGVILIKILSLNQVFMDLKAIRQVGAYYSTVIKTARKKDVFSFSKQLQVIVKLQGYETIDNTLLA